jgi:glycosyltransferase involved in cell wall biosynthesis
MKRVLVSIYIDPEFYPPTKNAIFELAKDVEEVIVLTRNLFKPLSDDYPGNVRFVKIGSYRSVQESEKISYFSKVWTFFSFWFNYQCVLLGKQIDVVIFYDPMPLLAFYLGIKPKETIYWYHNHDMPNIELTGKFSIGWFSAIFEHKAMKKINYFSLPSNDRLVYYPNWTHMDHFFYIPNYPRIAQFQQINLNKRFKDFTVIFQGAIGEGHGLEDFISILPHVPEVNLVLKGPVKNSYKDKLITIADSFQVAHRLLWFGITPYNELIDLTSRCHLGIAIHQGKDEVSKTLGTSSNKIYEYLACGLPIILQNNEQFRKSVIPASHVFFYDGHANEFIDIIKEVRNNFDELTGQARRSFFNQYVFETYFQQVIDKLSA